MNSEEREVYACDSCVHSCCNGKRVVCGAWTRGCGSCDSKDAEIAKLREICGMSTPWPIHSILQKLCECADILLDERSYDGHGWELIHEAREQARDRIAALQKDS